MKFMRPLVCFGWVVLSDLASTRAGPAEISAVDGKSTAAAVAAGVSEQAGQEERALRREQLELARTLYAAHPTADAAFALALVCKEQGDLTAAIRYWQEGLQKPPETVRLHDRAEVLAETGEALRLQEQPEAAEQAFRESLRWQPKREKTLVQLGTLLLARDRAQECLTLLEQGEAKSALAYGLMGRACLRLDRNEEARQHLARAWKAQPDLAEVCYGLSVVSARLGDTAEAETYRATFARLKTAQQNRGREYRASLNVLHTTRQSVALTHGLLGWLCRERGDMEQAERLWRRAGEVDAADTASRFQLLMMYQKAGRNADALRVCQEMIQAEPQNPFHLLGLGNLEARMGRRAESLRAFEEAHRLGPDRAETCFALAQAYLRQETNLMTAAELARQAAERAPAAPHLHLYSRLAARVGDRPAALAASQKACELAPDNSEYLKWRRALQGDTGAAR